MRPATSLAWRLGLMLALAPAGCAHHTGALPAGSVPGRTEAAPAVAGSGTPAGAEAPVVVAPAEQGVTATAEQAADNQAEDDLLAEDLDLLDAPIAPYLDPLAPWNRVMFKFNDKFYFWLLKPVSQAYRKVVPTLARTGFENFFNNLSTPGRFISNLLQLKGREATIELGKFMINSTWGVLGFGNLFAGNPETTIPDADLGLALAHHGVPSGPYVVWPILGPYTLRDSVGWIGGLFLDPITYIDSYGLSLGTRSYSVVNYTSFRIGDYEALKDASIDPYLAARDAYLQHRADQAKE